jgi:DNA-binding HxlR family transcriptional regulator
MSKRLRRYFHCPAELTFHLLGGKWRVAVVAQLESRAMRYSELRRAVPELSDKVLAATLRELESLGIIVRASFNCPLEPVPIGLYRLSAKGHALSPMLTLASAWARAHAAEYGIQFLHGLPQRLPDTVDAEFAPRPGRAPAPALQVAARSSRTATR